MACASGPPRCLRYPAASFGSDRACARPQGLTLFGFGGSDVDRLVGLTCVNGRPLNRSRHR